MAVFYLQRGQANDVTLLTHYVSMTPWPTIQSSNYVAMQMTYGGDEG